MEIIRDPMWQFIGALFAFITISVTLTIYLLQRKKKRFNYEIISKLPLLSFREELEGKFKIYYEDNLVKNVFSVIIKFYNTGNQPITSNDFERNLSLNFEEKTKILAYSVSKTEPENLEIQLKLNDSKLIIAPLLLNPKDNFTIRLIVTEAEAKFKLDYRIIGINKIIEGSPTQTTFFISTILGLILTIVGIVTMVTSQTNIDKSPFESVQSSIAFILIMVGYGLAFIGIISRKRMINRIIFALRRLVK